MFHRKYFSPPGLTAIEAWMLSCILFVFGALVGQANITKKIFVKKVKIFYIISEYAIILMQKQTEAIRPQRSNHVKVYWYLFAHCRIYLDTAASIECKCLKIDMISNYCFRSSAKIISSTRWLKTHIIRTCLVKYYCFLPLLNIMPIVQIWRSRWRSAVVQTTSRLTASSWWR